MRHQRVSSCPKSRALCFAGMNRTPPSQTQPVRLLPTSDSRHDGRVRFPARPARGMGDPCRQVSWLAALAPRAGLPDCACARSVAYVARGSPPTVAGAAAASERACALHPHRVPFSPAPPLEGTETGTSERSERPRCRFVNRYVVHIACSMATVAIVPHNGAPSDTQRQRRLVIGARCRRNRR